MDAHIGHLRLLALRARHVVVGAAHATINVALARRNAMGMGTKAVSQTQMDVGTGHRQLHAHLMRNVLLIPDA
jgi:hypothetical protein